MNRVFLQKKKQEEGIRYGFPFSFLRLTNAKTAIFATGPLPTGFAKYILIQPSVASRVIVWRAEIYLPTSSREARPLLPSVGPCPGLALAETLLSSVLSAGDVVEIEISGLVDNVDRRNLFWREVCHRHSAPFRLAGAWEDE